MHNLKFEVVVESIAGFGRWLDLTGPVLHRTRRVRRRGGVQHRYDRISGDSHRSVLHRTDRHHDLPPHGQLRHQQRGPGVPGGPRGRLHRQRVPPLPFQLALPGQSGRLFESLWQVGRGGPGHSGPHQAPPGGRGHAGDYLHPGPGPRVPGAPGPSSPQHGGPGPGSPGDLRQGLLVARVAGPGKCAPRPDRPLGPKVRQKGGPLRLRR